MAAVRDVDLTGMERALLAGIDPVWTAGRLTTASVLSAARAPSRHPIVVD